MRTQSVNRNWRDTGLSREAAEEVRIMRDALIQVAFANGETLKAIADMTNMSPSGVRARALRLGVNWEQRQQTLAHLSEIEDVEMERLYRSGWGLKRIGRHLGLTDTPVYQRLLKRGVQMRPRKLALLRPSIVWNGRRYHFVTTKRCYVSSSKPKTYLSRDVWEFHCGHIPGGHEVRHLDGDPSNNDLSNLVCLSRADGTRLNIQRLGLFKQDPGERFCRRCGAKLERKRSETYSNNGGWEPYHQFARRHYCGLDCSNADQKGKPRYWSPDHPVEREYPEKHCRACGEQLHPRVQVGGKLDGVVEAPSMFAKRQTCNQQCAGVFQRGKPKHRRLPDLSEQAADQEAEL